MQFFLWLVFVLVIGMAIFMVQNSTAPSVVIKFLFWNFETSLIYTILVSVGSGMLIIFFLWIPRSIKASFRQKKLKKEIEILERQMKPQVETSKPLENPQRWEMEYLLSSEILYCLTRFKNKDYKEGRVEKGSMNNTCYPSIARCCWSWRLLPGMWKQANGGSKILTLPLFSFN